MIAISLLKKLDGLSQIERASIQSLADNHALDRQRGQMVQIVQRANAARRDQSATQTSQSVEHRAQSRQIWSLQSSIARDIGIDKAPHARRAEFAGQRARLHPRSFAPAANRHQPVACIYSYYDTLAPTLQRASKQLAIDQRRRAQDHALCPHLKEGLDMFQRAQAAAHLNVYTRLTAQALNGSRIDRLAGLCAIQIHHVQPARARLLPAERDLNGIVGIGRHLLIIALEEAHASSINQIDRRQEHHWRTHFTKLLSSCNPTFPLFSG